MNCAGCGFDVAPDFAFCPKCGQKQPRTCAGCGFACLPDFAFCPKCGAALAGAAAASPAPAGRPTAPAPAAAPAASVNVARPDAPSRAAAPEADRRLVTVLFADVSGFTSLGERLDPEDVRAFQNDLFRMLGEAIEQYGGFVEKYVGDAVMAVFGAPVAHEDDAERALRTALAMLEGMRSLSMRWEVCFGGPVLLHVGVNSGPVVAGRIGKGDDGAYAVTGDTVNTAARLLSAAESGEILASEATRRLTSHAFAFEPLPPLSLKGKAEPVEVWRVRGLAAALSSVDASAGTGLAAPLVGRRDELEQTLAACDRALGGRAQIVTLLGEAGTGKSRLVAECFATLEDTDRLAGASIRRAVASSLGEEAFGVVRTLFREGYRLEAGEAPAAALERLRAGLGALGLVGVEAERVVPVLAYLLGLSADARLEQLEPEQLRRQIFLATRLVVERRLERGPLVLIVENLQWADAASIELLGFLADRLHDRPLLLLVTSRPGGAAVPTSHATQTTLRLAPLGADESRQLVAELLGAAPRDIASALDRLVVERAGGNPLYMVEIVRSLVASGALARGASGWAWARDPAALDVPQTLQGLLLSRVDRLPPTARRLLQDAAVLGPTFALDVLHAMSGGPALDDGELEALEKAELIEAVVPRSNAPGPPVRRYRFAQVMVQEAVYQNLLVARRAETHDRAARAIEAAAESPSRSVADIEALGHHLCLGTDRLRGVDFLVAAGDRARAVYANDDALRHYERAARTLREGGASDRDWPVRERLGDLFDITGRRGEAAEHYEAARRAQEGDARAQARLLRKLGGLDWDAGDRTRALERFRAGLDALAAGGDGVESAHLYQEMGRMAFRSGESGQAQDWARRALDLAERLLAEGSEPETRREAALVVSHACNTLGVSLARLDRRQEAVAHIERSIQVALDQELMSAACRGYTNLGILYSMLDPARGVATCLEGLEAAKRIGDLAVQSRLYANLAVAYCALTDRCEEEGIEAAQASIDLDRQLGQLDHLAVPLIVLGQIYQCHGEPSRALGYYREALGIVEAAGEPQLLFPCYDGLATLHLDLGEQIEAERYLGLAQDVCARAGLDPDSLVLLPFLG